LLAVFCLVFSLAFPWYFIHVRAELKNHDHCDILKMYGWEKVYCDENCGEKITGGAIELCDDSTNWRKESGVDHRKSVYNVAAAFLAATVFCSLIVTAGFTVNLCGFQDNRHFRKFYGSIGIIGLFCLLFTIIYFPIQHPRAWERDNECWPNAPSLKGVCGSFIGSDKSELGPLKLETWWGGAGYWAAVVGWVPLAVATMLAFAWKDWVYEYKETQPILRQPPIVVAAE